jgi:hypothetical protein
VNAYIVVHHSKNLFIRILVCSLCGVLQVGGVEAFMHIVQIVLLLGVQIHSAFKSTERFLLL